MIDLTMLTPKMESKYFGDGFQIHMVENDIKLLYPLYSEEWWRCFNGLYGSRYNLHIHDLILEDK